MDTTAINEQMERYITDGEMAGGALIIRRGGEIIYKNKWGSADIRSGKPIEYNSIYRMMSMTKCVTAVGILKLIEQKRIALDDPLAKYIPAFSEMRVADDARYQFHEGMKMTDILPKLLFFRMSKVKSLPAARQITIRDLLSHSSGLEQGVVGLLAMMKDKRTRKSLPQQAAKYAAYALDFHPGTGTGYSPAAGFDMLTYVIEIASGVSADEYLRREVFIPLGMTDTAFRLSDEQGGRLVSLYKRKKSRLIDVTGTKNDIDGMLHRGKDYIAGCGGLYSTLEDYERFAAMLCGGGEFDGVRILLPETVELMHTEAPAQHLEPEPGFVWGLGVKIRQQPQLGGSFATPGTYGWSGAFGTHFFVSPADDLDCVFTVNRSDLNGAGSFISNRVEELVFGIFTDSARVCV